MKICVVPIVLVFAMTLGSIASGQTSVYDARGRFVGKYQAYVGSTSGDDFGEAAIRQINGVWLALQVSTAGFTGVPPSSYYAEPTGDIFFSGANCAGKPYLGSSSDAQVGSPGDLMAAVPLVQEGIVINSTVYYIDPSSFLLQVTSPHPTICSVQTTQFENEGKPINPGSSACEPVAGLLPAATYNLTDLHLTPPFTLR
jgi:hypothetical protein